jgi:hypothetical protein
MEFVHPFGLEIRIDAVFSARRIDKNVSRSPPRKAAPVAIPVSEFDTVDVAAFVD